MVNNIQEIYTRLTTDQAFAEELKKFVEDKNIVSAEDGATAFVEFAKLHGYDITIDDLKAFIETQNRALSEEELEKINAAGVGGFCLVVGWGWNEAYGAGWTKCSVIGGGLGITWGECNEPGNEDAGLFAKKVVTAIAKIGAGAKPHNTGL
ncbi:MAG: Nif11-like leader peptide family natural product precursor [Lentisphaeria bacterium]|nr:Nif11-like leader peptide family natural product precursor [Lentisphaeria bacterium]